MVDGAFDQFFEAPGRHGHGAIVAGPGAPPPWLILFRALSGDQRRSSEGGVMARAASRDIVILGSRRKARLEAIVRRPSTPQALARRARIVLLAHAGSPNARIAA